uniref:Uncharacterized protein n=1 Tax=Anguilla anguilla TaxID=7936 RepID=A0A0E9UPI2_ANGAN
MPSELLVKSCLRRVSTSSCKLLFRVIYSAALEFPPSIFIFVFVIAFHS